MVATPESLVPSRTANLNSPFASVPVGRLELNYPDVIFIPSPDGFGSINILGVSNSSLTKSYLNTFGTLFALSSGLESLSKSTYIGIGTIYSQEIFGICKLNLFEIPRTYVCII